MQVKGNHTFKVTKQQLWDYLMDTEVLEKITPGVSKLEHLGEDSYKTVSDIKIGPVKGSFKGKLKVVDKNEPDSFTIEMEQLSKIGNAHARIEMNLSDAESNDSALSFDGKANLSGVIARTGQRVLSGVANAITKEVFSSLETHIEEENNSTFNEEKSSTESNSLTEREIKKETQSAEESNAHQSDEKSTKNTNSFTERDLKKETRSEAESNGNQSEETHTTEAHSLTESKVKKNAHSGSNKELSKAMQKSQSEPESNGGIFQAIIHFFKRLFN